MYIKNNKYYCFISFIAFISNIVFIYKCSILFDDCFNPNIIKSECQTLNIMVLF